MVSLLVFASSFNDQCMVLLMNRKAKPSDWFRAVPLLKTSSQRGQINSPEGPRMRALQTNLFTRSYSSCASRGTLWCRTDVHWRLPSLSRSSLSCHVIPLSNVSCKAVSETSSIFPDAAFEGNNWSRVLIASNVSGAHVTTLKANLLTLTCHSNAGAAALTGTRAVRWLVRTRAACISDIMAKGICVLFVRSACGAMVSIHPGQRFRICKAARDSLSIGLQRTVRVELIAKKAYISIVIVHGVYPAFFFTVTRLRGHTLQDTTIGTVFHSCIQ